MLYNFDAQRNPHIINQIGELGREVNQLDQFVCSAKVTAIYLLKNDLVHCDHTGMSFWCHLLNFFFDLMFRFIMVFRSCSFISCALSFYGMCDLDFVNSDFKPILQVFNVENWTDFSEMIIISTTSNSQKAANSGLNEDYLTQQSPLVINLWYLGRFWFGMNWLFLWCLDLLSFGQINSRFEIFFFEYELTASCSDRLKFFDQ